MRSKRFLVINRRTRAGFFSDFFWGLAGAQVAEVLRLKPVFNFGDLASNFDNRKWRWSLYFQNPWAQEFVRAPHLGVFLDSIKHPNLEVTQDAVDEKSSLSAAFHREIGFTDRTTDLFLRAETGLLQRKLLGVHFRAGDMRTAPSHPTPPTLWQIESAIRKELEAGDFDTIYFSSTNKEYGRQISKKFRKQIEFVTRDTLLQGAETSFDEVLLDVFALGNAERLICSRSNVSTGAFFFAKNSPDLILLENGTNPSSLIASLTLGPISNLRKQVLRSPSDSILRITKKT
jgi:hypothetical protein